MERKRRAVNYKVPEHLVNPEGDGILPEFLVDLIEKQKKELGQTWKKCEEGRVGYDEKRGGYC